jgi:hypothetical protein
LSPEFLCSYFPRLAYKKCDDSFIKFVNRGAQSSEISRPRCKTASRKSYKDDEEETSSREDEDVDSLFDVNDSAHNGTPSETLKSSTEDAEKVEDAVFLKHFAGGESSFASIDHLGHKVDEYEKETGVRIKVLKSEGGRARLYVCASHEGCCFRVKFGKLRQTDKIVYKSKTSYPFHSGPLVVNKRRPKRRLKGRLDGSVDKVLAVKEAKPVAKDVVKTAANFDSITINYGQGYRALGYACALKNEHNHLSFQLIPPYLNKFVALNPGSVARFQCDEKKHIERIFLCPGLMQQSLRYVRPVISLDAAHLRSKWEGVLYVASVKSGCDDIYPVAFALMKGNENHSGWQWFLEQLRSSIDLLVMEHPRTRVQYKYFSFVSDRQKGLIPALQQVFPDNHACYCSIHIARNTERLIGKKVASYIYQLANTFSHRESEEILTKIEEKSIQGRSYLEAIPNNQWRGTAWVDDHALPPRYGVTTTNMSESTNSMLEAARDLSWLECMDTIVKKMVERIVTLREKYRGKTGVVESMLGLIQRRWENCAGFQVFQIADKGSLFNIVRQSRGRLEPGASYTIDVASKTCECGKWQDHAVPCIDAMAYFKLHENQTFQYVLDNHVDKQYTYGYVQELFRLSIIPVCLETISRDGETLPPTQSAAKTTGRPRTKRLRKRSRFSHEPEKSNIVCSRCRRPGHNIRTCLAREALERNNGMLSLADGGGAELTMDRTLPELDLS